MHWYVYQKTLVMFIAIVLTYALNFIPAKAQAQQFSKIGFNNFSNDKLIQLQESAEKLRLEGQLAESAAVYQELFLAIRANLGLYTEQQFVVLDRLIALEIDCRDWESLNQHLSYQEWLSKRLYADNPVALSEQLQANSRHRMRAASYQQGPQRSWHIVQARTHLWRAVSTLEKIPAQSGRLPDLWFQIANFHYALTNDAQRWRTSFEARTDEPVLISGWALGANEVEQRSYEIGLELLQKIYSYYNLQPEPQGIDSHVLAATLLSYQGDWELLFDQSHRALYFYEQAIEFSSRSPCAAELENFLFGNNVEVPVYHLNVTRATCEFIRHSTRPEQSKSTSTLADVDESLKSLYGQPKVRPKRKNGRWMSESLISDISLVAGENLDD